MMRYSVGPNPNSSKKRKQIGLNISIIHNQDAVPILTQAKRENKLSAARVVLILQASPNPNSSKKRKQIMTQLFQILFINFVPILTQAKRENKSLLRANQLIHI